MQFAFELRVQLSAPASVLHTELICVVFDTNKSPMQQGARRAAAAHPICVGGPAALQLAIRTKRAGPRLLYSFIACNQPRQAHRANQSNKACIWREKCGSNVSNCLAIWQACQIQEQSALQHHSWPSHKWLPPPLVSIFRARPLTNAIGQLLLAPVLLPLSGALERTACCGVVQRPWTWLYGSPGLLNGGGSCTIVAGE